MMVMMMRTRRRRSRIRKKKKKTSITPSCNGNRRPQTKTKLALKSFVLKTSIFKISEKKFFCSFYVTIRLHAKNWICRSNSVICDKYKEYIKKNEKMVQKAKK